MLKSVGPRAWEMQDLNSPGLLLCKMVQNKGLVQGKGAGKGGGGNRVPRWRTSDCTLLSVLTLWLWKDFIFFPSASWSGAMVRLRACPCCVDCQCTVTWIWTSAGLSVRTHGLYQVERVLLVAGICAGRASFSSSDITLACPRGVYELFRHVSSSEWLLAKRFRGFSVNIILFKKQ